MAMATQNKSACQCSAVLAAGWRIVVLTTAERARCSRRSGSVADGCSTGKQLCRSRSARLDRMFRNVRRVDQHAFCGDRRDREGVGSCARAATFGGSIADRRAPTTSAYDGPDAHVHDYSRETIPPNGPGCAITIACGTLFEMRLAGRTLHAPPDASSPIVLAAMGTR